ncbi:MAG: hypothetical protein ACHQO8_11750 [Vicinamibacterales bacterium]
MTRAARAACAIVVAFGVGRARPAAAQSPEPGRFEAGIGPLWTGGASLGSRDANETTSTGGAFPLFSTSTELSSAAGVEARAGVRVWQRFEAEASASYGRAELRTTVGNDSEGAAAVTAAETIHQFTFNGGVVWYPPRPRVGTRLTPFVSVNAGYLRQLHEAATLAVTGHVYQVGGGVKYRLVSRPSSHVKGIGVRLDVRVAARSGGVAFDARTRYAPTLGASLFARF